MPSKKSSRRLHNYELETRVSEPHAKYALSLAPLNLENYGAVERVGTVGNTWGGSSLYHPVEYMVGSGALVAPAAKRYVAYYVDDDAQHMVVPAAKSVYLDFKPEMLQHNMVTQLPPGTYEIQTVDPAIGKDYYELVEETVSGDTDPFGMIQKRRTLRDGSRTQRQEALDLVIRQAVPVATTCRKLPALDLAEAKGLSREALRNRIDKKTGRQHIQYVYEGFDDDDKVKILSGNLNGYGESLNIDTTALNKGSSYSYLSDPNYLSSSTTRHLNASSGGSNLKALPSSSYLSGTTLEGTRARRTNRYSSFKPSLSHEGTKSDRATYSYLDYLYFPSENYSDETASKSKGGKLKIAGTASGNMPFGLDYDDLLQDDGYFKTVTVDLKGKTRSRHLSTSDYPKTILPRKVFMDDIKLKSPRSYGTDYGSYRSSGYRKRHSSAEGYAGVPGLAGHMAGSIVNDALDGMFRYGSGTATYSVSNSTSYGYGGSGKGGYYSSLGGTKDYALEARMKSNQWKEEFEREERERERRRREREAERQLQMRKMDSDLDRDKRERERRDEDRKRDREQEKRRREQEWEAQQAEWERQKREREREREKLRRERDRIEEGNRLKAEQKFDPRVHTVSADDSKPDEMKLPKARVSETAAPMSAPKSPSSAPTRKKKMLSEVAEHDPGEVKNDRDPGTWEGHGHFKDERVIFNSDKGYINWTKPKGSLEVIYKNPEGLLNFGCKVEPKNPGMKIYEVREDAEVLIATGKGDSPGSLEFTAIDGVVIIVIETYDEEEELPSEFRLNWSLHA